MPDYSSNNKRIAQNTMFLYVRMIIIMAVTLYTSRVILKTLGAEDFGIYNLVGGIAAMFQFLNGTLTDATQRYITVEIGRGEQGNVNKLFSISLMLHVLLGLFIVIIAEPIGLWLLHNKLIIPQDRMEAATWIFHLSIFSLFILIVSVPYNALIVAHEKMKAFAMISIVDAVGRLVIAYSLIFSGMDKLILYGLLMLLLQAFLRLLYTHYCKRNFKESKYHYYWDKNLLKEMMGFASWTIIGNLAFVCITQGISILLGMFFLPVINAARGIAAQVQNAIATFVKNFQMAINPQITKTFASEHLQEMHSLIFRSSRFSFYLVMLPLIPLFLETDIILKIWLSDVPEYTGSILRIILIIVCMQTLSNPIGVSIKATGHIREFELYAASLYLLILPISYFLLSFGLSPLSPFVVYLVIEFLAFSIKLYITNKYVSFGLALYMRQVVVKILLVTILSIPIPVLVYKCLDPSILRLLIVMILTIICGFFAIILFGITSNEKVYLKHKLKLGCHSK